LLYFYVKFKKFVRYAYIRQDLNHVQYKRMQCS